MKKLIRYIVLFCLPLLLLLVIVPVDKRQVYEGLSGDCYNHGLWVHDRIFEQEKNTDIIFLGSSRTINSVDDSLLSTALAPMQVVNFGYCRLGRNLHHHFLQEILSRKKVRHLILEVRETEDQFSHPIYSYMAPTPSVLASFGSLNRQWPRDLWQHFTYKTSLIQQGLYPGKRPPEIEQRTYGFSSYTDSLKPEEVYRLQEKWANHARSYPGNMAYYFPRTYLEKIAALCEQNDIRLTFLYLPAFGQTSLPPLDEALYEELGEIWQAPTSYQENPHHWFDGQHRNQAGAAVFSQWLAEQLRPD
ncbi:MAG: hypothetical protein AAFR61_21525 [Bacteroidota bacterium]